MDSTFSSSQQDTAASSKKIDFYQLHHALTLIQKSSEHVNQLAMGTHVHRTGFIEFLGFMLSCMELVQRVTCGCSYKITFTMSSCIWFIVCLHCVECLKSVEYNIIMQDI